ncbi:MAG: DUF4296 domain-containing protein [Prevotellaceae bacterium]|jgi:hypothetical protein|nr:DUF4296 domain-containing protein [Prevotellaceae bacterium]
MRKFCIVFILTALISCSKQKIIPENTLAEIVYEMYITDAVLATHEPSIFHRDSMRIYEPVVEKFGYSLEDLRNTFLKYTGQDGRLQSVLAKVGKKIEDEKNIYQPVARIEKLSENMNVGADSISTVSRSVNKHSAEIRLSEQGVYDISASYFFYKNDSAKNPRMSVWLESKAFKDSVMDKQEISLIRDTVFRDYSAKVKFSDPTFNILKIYWLDCDNEPETIKPLTPTSQQAANRRIAGARKKTGTKIKPDTTTRQHYIIKGMTVKYNFEESDTTRLKEFIGPVLPDFLPKSGIRDSVIKSVDTIERIMAIKKQDEYE